MGKKKYYIDYTETLGSILPEWAFPLPIPCSLDAVKVPAWWGDFISFCEGVSRGAEAGEPIPLLPRKFDKCPKNPIMGSVWADIAVSLQFWHRWVSVPPEEDIPKYFPKGVASLIDSSRQDFCLALSIGKTGAWDVYIAHEYKEAYLGCMGLAAARRLGHWPSPEQREKFTVDDVTQAMKDTNGFSGVVNYSHIRNMLYFAASK